MEKSKMTNIVYEKLFRLKFLGHYVFRNKIIESEGGERLSTTLRNVAKSDYSVNVGLYTYGCCFSSYFNLGGTVNIGNYCSFATDIHYFGANHPMHYASTSPYFYNPVLGFSVKDIPRETLNIGNDVWCGYGVIITNKCHNIGNGAVIGAGSIVTSDIPPYAIVIGSPAKIKKYRFDETTISLLEESKWFELPPEKIMKYYEHIDEPKEFAQRIINDRKNHSI